jgi:hypothetical protein
MVEKQEKNEADFGITIYLQFIVAPSFQDLRLFSRLLNLRTTTPTTSEHIN